MPDISGQLIKDSYSYILQADTSTGYVYRVNGNVPVNPIFSSGLTVFSAFTFVDGSQQNGYVLTSDGSGNSRWAAVSGASVSSVTASTGLSGNSTTGAITLINTAPDQTVTISGGTGITTGGTYPNFSIVNTAPDQIVTISGGTGITTGGTYHNFSIVNTAPDQTVTITGGTNIEITGAYPDFGVNFTGQTSFPYLPLSGGTVTGDTIFESGLTANTISATTYYNLPIPFLRNETNSGTTDTITINQSIFNPSNLTVLSTSVFIVDTNADYYVLGDFYNSGTTIVNGTLKVGGVIYNSGIITGSGIIE